MSISLRAGTRVVVVIVAVDEYDAASGSSEGAFEALTGIEADLRRLEALFSGPRYRRAEFEMLPPLRGDDAADLQRQLRQLRRELEALGRDLALVLLWTGHGELVDDELRLVTRECTRPLHPSDGLGPAELVSRLSLPRVGSVTLLLDVCQAAAGAGPVLAGAARRLNRSQVDSPYFAGALFAAYPFQPAWDSVFIEALTRLLGQGPSPAARQRMEQAHAHRFHERDRELTLADINEVLLIELDLLRQEHEVSDPVLTFVNQPPRLFPNPLFIDDSPAQIVEVARRRRTLAADIDTHFLPKARGLDPSEEGWTFAGRERASAQVVDWLQGRGAAAAQPLLVLTGSGGSGKSALIGRLVTLEDPAARELARQAGWDEAADAHAGTVPAAGCIDAALHLRRLSSEQVVQALAGLLAMPSIEGGIEPSSFVAQVPAVQTLADGSTRPTTLVLDALDEANDPARIAQGLVAPLVRRGCRVLIGTRPSAAYKDAPQLLPLIGDGQVIDLDQEPDTATDLRQYVRRRLAHGPQAAQAEALATAVAERANGRFLYARMAASVLLRQPEAVTVPALGRLLGQGIGQALLQDLLALDAACLQQFPALGGRPATALFAALAYAEGAGLPLRDGLWPGLAQSLLPGEQPMEARHATWLLREGGHYIVEDGESGQAVYRLYHQALVDELRQQHGPGKDVQARLARTLQRHAEAAGGWAHANPYAVTQVLRHLAGSKDFARWGTQVLDFAWMQAFLGEAGIHALVSLLDWAWQSDHAARSAIMPSQRDGFMRCAAVATALRQSSAVLASDAGQLPTQLLGRLRSLPRGLVDVGEFLDDVASLARKPWLRPITPALGLEQSIRWLRPTGHHSMQPIAFSRDGHRAVHCDGQDVHLWDLAQWQELGRVCRPTTSVHALAVSDDGLSVIQGDSLGGVYRWRGGRVQGGGTGHEELAVVQWLQASADGRHAMSLTLHASKALVAWDFDTDRHEVAWSDPSVSVTAFALAADGLSALAAGSDGWLRHLHLWPCREIGRHRVDAATVERVALNDQKQSAAVACRDGKVLLIRLGSQGTVMARLGCESAVTAMAWSDDAKRLFLGCEDGRLQAWSLQQEGPHPPWERTLDQERAHSGPVQQVSSRGTRHDSFLSADALQIKEWRQSVSIKLPVPHPTLCAEAGLLPRQGGESAIGYGEGALYRWDLQRAAVTPPPPHRSVLLAPLLAKVSDLQHWRPRVLLCAERAERALAVGDDRIELWDVDTMARLASRSGRRIGAAAISAGGTHAAFADGDQLVLWDLAADDLAELGKSREAPRRLAFSADGQQLLGIGCGREVCAWWIDDPQAAPVRAHPDARDKPAAGLYVGPRLALVFSGNGEPFLVDTSEPGFAHAQPLADHHRSGVHSLLFDAQTDRLVSASWDGSLALWDTAAGQLLRRFEGAGGPLHQLSQPFGSVLMSTHGGVLRVVSLGDGRPRLSFQADHQIVAAAADPALRRIAAADQSGLLHVLHVVDDGPAAED